MDNLNLFNNNIQENPLNQLGSIVNLPNVKVINGKTTSDFINSVQANSGLQNAQKNEILRAFICLYDNGSDAMKNVANMLETGNIPQNQGIQNINDFLERIAHDLVNYFNGNVFRNNLGTAAYNYLQNYYNERNLAARFANNPQNNQNNEIHENVNENQINNQPENQVDPLVQRENQLLQENPNLIRIIDPNKQVNNMNWPAFHQQFAQKGWPNAEKSDTLRAIFNICGPDHPGMIENVNLVLNNIQAGQNPEEIYKEHLRNYVRDYILEPAKQRHEYKFTEEQRPSVLHYQQMLNSAQGEGYNYNLNADCPVRQQANPENQREQANQANVHPEQPNNNVENVNANNNANNNNQLNQNNPEGQAQPEQQVQPQQPQPVMKQRELLQNAAIHGRMLLAKDRLQRATLRARGSDEYKHVREEFSKVQEKWTRATSNQGGKISEDELLGLRDELVNVLELADTYMDKKYRENDKSRNAKSRMEAVEDAFDVLEEQLAIVNARREELRNTPPKSIHDLSTEAAAAYNDMLNNKLFLRGSDEYKKARESFKLVQDKLRLLDTKFDGNEANISRDELKETRELLLKADDALGLYAAQKSGEILADSTHNRVEAVNKGRTLIERAIRKLDALEKAKEVTEVKNMHALTEEARNLGLDMDIAERDVHLGSSEYKDAKKEFNAFTTKLSAINVKNNNEITARDMDDLSKEMDKAEEKIDLYLQRKRSKLEWDEKGTERIGVMRKAKENIAETRRRVEAINKARHAEALAKDPAALIAEEDAALADVKLAQRTVDGSKVWRGGDDYDKALIAYERVCNNEKQLNAPNRQNELSRHALKAEIEELNKAKEDILTYTRRKESEKTELEGKGKSLDAKGTKRLEVMNNAYKTIRTRLDVAQAKLGQIDEREKQQQDQEIQRLLNDRRADIPNEKGANKIVAMESAHSMDIIARYSRQKEFSEGDRNLVYTVTAKLLLAENILKGKFKSFNPPTMKNFNDMASKFRESKEFKDAMKGEKMDPEFCRNLLVGKKNIENINKKVLGNIQKNGDKAKIRQTSIRENLKGKENATKGRNPLIG